ncbi:MAG: adenylate/guanylate cyclase domain-containing protein [Saprospiraceae bacterium]
MQFINQIIQNNYSHFDEDRKRNVSILIILISMLIVVQSIWVVGFWVLKMPEIFWVDTIILIGYIALFISMVFYKMPFTIARSIALVQGYLITGIPVIFFGLESNAALHLVFLPMATILLFSRKEKKQFLIYFGMVLIGFILIVLCNFKYGPLLQPPAETLRTFNLLFGIDGIFIAMYFTYFFFTENTKYKTLLYNEREKSDNLLLSIFPKAIANKLRHSNQSVADSFENVTILFADIVGFTRFSGTMSPNELVNMLDEIFSEFDNLVDKYNIEKIKTIGDAYMAVGGLPVPSAKHCQNVADLALEINQIIKNKYKEKYNLQLRIGMYTGIAIAGVIGTKKFSYDLWGDSVNIASRFESNGQPEKIHITEDVKNALGDAYLFEYGGEIPIKGKGLMKSYFLLGKKSS